MGISLGSNILALNAQRRLDNASSALLRSFERLASGLRINRASDDAAGLAIAASLNADARVFNQGARNINDGVSYLDIAEGTVRELTNITIRISELAEQGANGVYSNAQRRALDDEAQALSSEYTRILDSTEFNDLRPFDPSQGVIRIQAGYGLDGSLAVDLGGPPETVGDGTFQAGVNFPGNRHIVSQTVADFDGDGDQDVAMVHATAISPLTIQLNDGSGNFTEVIQTTAIQAGVIRHGDLNGDNKIDLIIANNNGTNVTVHLGNGNGSFNVASTFATVTNAEGLAVVDVNGDGKLDLAVSGDGAMSIMFGDGNGTFGATVSFADAGNADALVAADFDHDGDVDIATNSASDAFSVFIGDGNGSFAAMVSYSLTHGISGGGGDSIHAADFNDDGHVDLISSGGSSGDGALHVILGTGTGAFGTAIVTGTGAFADTADSYIDVGDVNGDGLVDVIAQDSGSWQIYQGTGSGSFSPLVSADPASLSTPETLSLVDLNNDGALDIVVGANTSGISQGGEVVLGNTVLIPGEALEPLPTFSIATRASAREALDLMVEARERLISVAGKIGAFQVRLATARNNLLTTVENVRSAESQIKDADIAVESAELTRRTILQQAAQGVLAQANQAPALALQLLAAR